MTRITPKPISAVDQIILGHVRDILRGVGQPMTMLAIATEVAKRMGGELTKPAQLYGNHPSRLAVADCVLALHGAGELEPLMTPTLLEHEGRGL